ncbi:MAG: T9SS type A sorting domain-containing protein, partial [Crocinitomicaceae bacterium]
ENYNELLQVISIEIVDAFGKRALKVASKDETINISKLPAGTYFLTINHDAGQEVVKFIKR